MGQTDLEPKNIPSKNIHKALIRLKLFKQIELTFLKNARMGGEQEKRLINTQRVLILGAIQQLLDDRSLYPLLPDSSKFLPKVIEKINDIPMQEEDYLEYLITSAGDGLPALINVNEVRNVIGQMAVIANTSNYSSEIIDFIHDILTTAICYLNGEL
jgi:hypothetical protein